MPISFSVVTLHVKAVSDTISMITKQDSLQLQKDFKKVFVTKAEMNARFDKMDVRFDKIDTRLDKMDARFDKINARFDKMDKDNEEQTLSLAQTFNQINDRFIAIEKRLDMIEEILRRMDDRQSKMEEFMKVMSLKLLNHDGRIVTLESKILLS